MPHQQNIEYAGTPLSPGTHKLAAHTVAKSDPQPNLGEIPSPRLCFYNSLGVIVVLVALGILATRNLKMVPGRLQNVAEMAVESLSGMARNVIGPGYEKHVPLIGTVFLYILVMNLIGLIPIFKSPTSNLSITLALGLTVFFYVQYIGIRSNGLWGYIKHFAGPIPAVAILMFPIELVSELAKPFTLAVRLFGNIFGEDTVIVVLAYLSATLLPKWLPIPFQFPILLLDLLVYFVQALVFTMLTCVYLSLMSHHEEESGAEPAH